MLLVCDDHLGAGAEREAGLRCGSGEAPRPQEECERKSCFWYYFLEFKGLVRAVL